jgi:uncharacterized damage-inducible protein DinB
MTQTKRIFRAESLPGCAEEIGRWLWALQDVRSGILRAVQGLDQRTLEWEGPRADENSIGTLLYHIALVEIDWLFSDLHGAALPDPLQREFPFPFATDGRLTPVRGVSLADHLARLERTRKVFLDDIRAMSLGDWRRLRSPKGEDYDVNPEWVAFHLVEHEAGHAGQIRALKSRAERFFGVS